MLSGMLDGVWAWRSMFDAVTVAEAHMTPRSRVVGLDLCKTINLGPLP
jgi:hypothetical protein